MLSSAPRFVALDVHKHYVVALGVNQAQEVVMPIQRFAVDALEKWAGKALRPSDLLVLESTTNAWDFYDRLSPYVAEVKVAHPLLVKLIASARVKTDKRDVRHLAHLLAANLVPEVWVPPKEVRQLRSLVAHRDALVNRISQIRNRLHSYLHRYNIARPKGADLFSQEQRTWWQTLAVSKIDQLRIQHDLQSFDQSQQQKEATEVQLAQLSMTEPWISTMPFLVQLPGIGMLSAMMLLAVIGDIERFPSPKHLVGYAGLGASVHESGETSRYGGITKQGRRDLRARMIESAWIAVIHDAHWKQAFQALSKRIGKHKAIVAMARRLLVVVWYVWSKHEVAHHSDRNFVTRKLMTWASEHSLATSLKLRRLDFVRQHLDTLGIGQDLKKFKYGARVLELPPSKQAVVQ